MKQQQEPQQSITSQPLAAGGILQRKCEGCGQHTIASSRCLHCQKQPDVPDDRPQEGGGSGKFSPSFSRVSVRSGTAVIGPSPLAQLRVSQPGDRHEKEAEQAADQVMGRSPVLQPPALQPLPVFASRLDSPSAGPVHANFIPQMGGLQSRGQPLPAPVRSFMEPRFGADFSQARVYRDQQASELAQQIDARAFTLGRDIFFDRGEYAPDTHAGRRLLAHELSHVIQQGYAALHQVGDWLTGAAPATLLSRTSHHLARTGRSTRREPMSVSHVVIYLADHYIDFHTSRGTFRYYLDYTGLVPGEYSATVTIRRHDVHFDLQGHIDSFEFTYRIEPSKPNPSTFFVGQSTVMFTITAEAAPEFIPPEEREERPDDDPNVTYISLTEAMRRC